MPMYMSRKGAMYTILMNIANNLNGGPNIKKSCQTFAFNDFELLLKKIHPSPMVLFNLF